MAPRRSRGKSARKTSFKKAATPSEEGRAKVVRRHHKQEKIDDNLEPKLSFKFRDVNIKLSEDRQTATGYKGWTSIFSTHCASVGNWYFEIQVLPDVSATLKFVGHPLNSIKIKGGHIRVGYACRYQRYDTPIGINKSGCSLSDVDGAIVFDKTKRSYLFPFGDVVGCFISLQEPTTQFRDPRMNMRLYEFIQQGILCDPNEPPESSVNEKSFIQFSINGQMGEPCKVPIHDGFYHPGISLYMGARATINFGPEFKYPPPIEHRPCIEMPRPPY